ncbi:MAG TPA: glycoside hydrolase family 3 C-terminal domain-containing protein [Tepidisphaeraceae bacterium]
MLALAVFSFSAMNCEHEQQETSQTKQREMKASVDQQVDQLLSQLTLDEKLSMISGYKVYKVAGVPRLGIPEIKMTDGPIGTRNDGKSTAYPGDICLAASWDTELAHEFGVSQGRDGRARADHVILGPAMNIYRIPIDGRNSEYMGEDPFLTGTMASHEIQGIQSQGVVSTVKHYAANNQEEHRMTVSANVDERTLREIYLRGFQIAITQGHPWAVMCAYNKINDVYCSANRWLLTDVLKDEWDFPGLVMSDWGAVHDTLGPANAGLDIEMPGQEWFTPAKLKPLIDSGKISMPTIDDKIRRILRVEVSMGFINSDRKDASIPLDDPSSRATALKMAEEGIVLLKNRDGLLPLDTAKVKTVAVVGPNAEPAITGCGGSSYVDPYNPVSTLAGIQNEIGADRVEYVPASEKSQIDAVIAHSMYEPLDPNTQGIKAEYFANRDLSGSPVLIRQMKKIDQKWGRRRPPAANLPSNDFSARFTAKIRPPTDGTYLFSLSSHEGSRLFINGEQVIDMWSSHGNQQENVHRELKGGKVYDIRVDFFSNWPSCSVQFGWGPALPLIDEQAAEKIAKADAAVLCVGFNPQFESEGFDRTYALPQDQEKLIQKVEALNPHTIVVVNCGGNVAMANWIDNAAGLIQAWYPGEEGGRALAEIIFGKVNPSGKLPATFEKKWEDSPGYANYPGKNDEVSYKEGVFVGYRWFDAKGIVPRYPFGFGLSYTSFALSDLKIKHVKGHENELILSANVKNTGDRIGSDVIQFYVGQDQPTLPTPPRKLAGFARVELLPGQKKTVQFHVDASTLAYWHPNTKQWSTDSGGYHVWVGESSRDLPLTAPVEWR